MLNHTRALLEKKGWAVHGLAPSASVERNYAAVDVVAFRSNSI